MTLEILCSRTTGRPRMPIDEKKSRKTVLCDVFSSFCRPECGSRPVA